MYDIVTIRFNIENYEENEYYREVKNVPGCIYGLKVPMTSKVNYGDELFVIEMNNEINKVMGIGLMIAGEYSCITRIIYSNPVLNRYIYEGRYRLDREEITDEYHKEVIKVLDLLLFKGARHSKRNKGISRFPKWLKYNKYDFRFIEVFKEMFEMYKGLEFRKILKIV